MVESSTFRTYLELSTVVWLFSLGTFDHWCVARYFGTILVASRSKVPIYFKASCQILLEKCLSYGYTMTFCMIVFSSSDRTSLRCSQWRSVRQNVQMWTHLKMASFHHYWHVTRDGSTHFTQSWWGNISLCFTTVWDVKSLCVLGSLTTLDVEKMALRWHSTSLLIIRSIGITYSIK